jgi:hypothetical protein
MKIALLDTHIDSSFLERFVVIVDCLNWESRPLTRTQVAEAKAKWVAESHSFTAQPPVDKILFTQDHQMRQ